MTSFRERRLQTVLRDILAHPRVNNLYGAVTHTHRSSSSTFSHKILPRCDSRLSRAIGLCTLVPRNIRTARRRLRNSWGVKAECNERPAIKVGGQARASLSSEVSPNQCLAHVSALDLVGIAFAPSTGRRASGVFKPGGRTK